MCIGSNWVNEAQDLKFVTKFEDLPNSLIPSTGCVGTRVLALLTKIYHTGKVKGKSALYFVHT